MAKNSLSTWVFVCLVFVFVCQCAEGVSSKGEGANVSEDLVVDSEDADSGSGDVLDSDKAVLDSDLSTEVDTGSVRETTWVSLEFTLESDSAPAGTPVFYEATLHGDDGSVQSVNVIIESDQEPEVEFDNERVTAKIAQNHTLTATAVEGGESLTATALLAVVPGEPSSIDLELLPTHPEVDKPLFVRATMEDAYGNICHDSWTLTVSAKPGSDASSVLVNGADLVFTKDGWFTLKGTVDASGLSNSLGPLLVDSYGPRIEIDEPERGTWSTAYDGAIRGKVSDAVSDVANLAVNGENLSIGEDGSFGGQLEYAFGINAIETLATDSDGNAATDRRSVLAGELMPKNSGIGDGIQVRINQDTISIIEEAGKNLVESADLNGLIPDPVFHSKEDTCLFGFCVRWYELTIQLSDVTLKNVDLKLDPRADGVIDATATVYAIHAPWKAKGVVAEIPYSASGKVSADSMVIQMSLDASIDNGQVETKIVDAGVSSSNFKFDFDSWIYDAAKFFGINLDGIVRGFVEDAIEDTVKKEIPKVLEDALNDLALGVDFDLLGGTYEIEAKPYRVDVDDLGLTLGLETFVSSKNWNISHEGQGSLYAGYKGPAYSSDPGLILGFSADFLSQALFAFWGGGLLQQRIEIGHFEMPFDSPYLPKEMENFQIVIDALLPPIVVPGSGQHLLDLQVGDVKIDLYSDDPDEPGSHFAVCYVGLTAGLGLEVSPQNTLEPDIQDVSLWLDFVEPKMPNGWEIIPEKLAATFIGELIPLIRDAIGSIPVPRIEGMSMSSIEIDKGGAENGYVTATGRLVVE